MTRKPWYSKGLRFQCTQCGNCCKSHGAYTYLYLARSEVRAIAEHRGETEAEFRARFCAEEEGWTILRPGASVCPFLGAENRCEVYPVRPMQCRTWPFWEENLRPDIWEREVKSTCPGAGRGPLYAAEEVQRIARLNEEWYEC